MFYVVFTLHIVLCVTLVGLVLLQQGKGADMGAAFGGGSSNTFFGAAGATAFITKLTTGVALSFMFTSILLVNIYSAHSRQVGSIVPAGADPIQALVGSAAPAPQEAPAAQAPQNNAENAAAPVENPAKK